MPAEFSIKIMTGKIVCIDIAKLGKLKLFVEIRYGRKIGLRASKLGSNGHTWKKSL